MKIELIEGNTIIRRRTITCKNNLPIKDEYDLTLPNVINIVSTPYRKAIQFVGKTELNYLKKLKNYSYGIC